MAYYPGMEGRGGRGSGYGPGSLYTPGGLSAVTGRHHSVEDEKGKYHYGRNRPGAAWDRSSGMVGGPGSYMAGAISGGYSVPPSMNFPGHLAMNQAALRREMQIRQQQAANDPFLRDVRKKLFLRDMGLLFPPV